MQNPKQSHRIIAKIFILLVLLISLVFNVRPVSAATIVVNTFVDEDVSNSDCSLREAIKAATTDTAYNGCTTGASGVDAITLPAGVYTLNSEIETIWSSEIVINGADAETTIIQASTCNPVTLPGGCTPATYRMFHLGTGSDLTLHNLTLRHGSETYGGAIISYGGTLSITDSTITGNLGNATNSKGGAIYIDVNSTLDITNSTITGNSSGQYGGAINNDEGTVTVTDSEIEENYAETYGGSIHNEGTPNVWGSTLYDNESGYGGAIHNGASGIVIIHDSNLDENQANTRGGAIENKGYTTVIGSTFFGNTSTNNGGGIYNYGGSYASISTSTLYGNNAGTDGGGIYASNSSEVHVTNSTLSGNTAVQEGGGIFTYNLSFTYLTNVTLSNNVAGTSGGGIYNDGYLEFISTIIANSTNGDCDTLTAPGNILPSSRSNLVEDNTCGADVYGDPMLNSLLNNGGPTLTHALLAGSPAIDAGYLGTCPATDQRGVNRPIGGGCDIGAFELEGVLGHFYLPFVVK